MPPFLAPVQELSGHLTTCNFSLHGPPHCIARLALERYLADTQVLYNVELQLELITGSLAFNTFRQPSPALSLHILLTAFFQNMKLILLPIPMKLISHALTRGVVHRFPSWAAQFVVEVVPLNPFLHSSYPLSLANFSQFLAVQVMPCSSVSLLFRLLALYHARAAK